jgi:hypothetical protein
MKLVIYLLICTGFSFYLTQQTPLDDYVKAPDPHYNYTLLKSYRIEGYTLYILNFTSQKWFDGRLFNHYHLFYLNYISI